MDIPLLIVSYAAITEAYFYRFDCNNRSEIVLERKSINFWVDNYPVKSGYADSRFGDFDL
jgi:hypothetical protein